MMQIQPVFIAIPPLIFAAVSRVSEPATVI